jgi:hypothetical protein
MEEPDYKLEDRMFRDMDLLQKCFSKESEIMLYFKDAKLA